MATLKDISAHLGLSVTQVSRALNGYSDVSSKTRKRVEEAAKALNYQPNLSARKLARGHSGMVAIVRRHFPEITKDSMFLEVVTGLSLEFAKRDMQLVLHVAPRENDNLNLLDKLIAGGAIDGFVLLEPVIDDARIAYLQSRNIPFVVHGRNADQPDYAFCDIDNENLGFALTQHLIDLGHQRILFLNGLPDRGYSWHRQKGHERAICEAKIAHAPMVENSRMNESFGREMVARYFDGDAPKPTAIICGHIHIAMGVYDALAARNLKVPDDVSVVAHDDDIAETPAENFNPPLTVSRAAIRNSWLPLSQFMSRAIVGEDAKTLQEIQPIELIVRNSTARYE